MAKTHLCPRCGKGFSTKGAVKIHLNGDKWHKPRCKGVKVDEIKVPVSVSDTPTKEEKPKDAIPSESNRKSNTILPDSVISSIPQSDDAGSVDSFVEKEAEVVRPVEPLSAEEMRRIRLNERLTKFMSAIFSGPMKQIGSAVRTKTERAPLSKERQALIDDLGEITQELFGLEFNIQPKVWKIEGFFTAVLAICGIYISLIFFPDTGEVLKTKPPAEKKEAEKPKNVTPIPPAAKTETERHQNDVRPKDGAWNNFGKDKGEL